MSLLKSFARAAAKPLAIGSVFAGISAAWWAGISFGNAVGGGWPAFAVLGTLMTVSCLGIIFTGRIVNNIAKQYAQLQKIKEQQIKEQQAQNFLPPQPSFRMPGVSPTVFNS